MKNTLFRKYKTTLKPISIIAIAIILSLISAKVFWDKIQEIRRKNIANEGQNQILQERLNTLNSLVIEASESSTLLQFALPQTNPAVLILSHLNNLSSTHSVTLDKLTANSSGSGTYEAQQIKSVSIGFELLGSYDQVYAFISDLSTIAPIVNLDAVKFENEDTEGLRAEVRITGFYASLPESLPPITSPLDDFSPEEKSTINFLETFAKPDINPSQNEFDAIVPTGKENPFEEIL